MQKTKFERRASFQMQVNGLNRAQATKVRILLEETSRIEPTTIFNESWGLIDLEEITDKELIRGFLREIEDEPA